MATLVNFTPRKRRGTEALLLCFALLLATSAFALVGVGIHGNFSADTLTFAGFGFVFCAVLHIVVRIRAAYADPLILPIVVLINGLGVTLIYSLDQLYHQHQPKLGSFAPKQMMWTGVGVALAVIVLLLLKDYRILRRYRMTFALVGIGLLALPLVPVLGVNLYGARIWVSIAGFSLQPSELAKIAFAIFLAAYLSAYRDTLTMSGVKVLGIRLPHLKDFIPMLLAWVCCIGVMVFETDFGTALLFFGLFVAVLYMATERKSWIVIGLTLFVAAAVLVAPHVAHIQVRINGWLHALDPSVYNLKYGNSQQLVSGLFGLANGGLTGAGLGSGRPDLVPFANSDFIYTSAGEQLGLGGMIAIIALYMLLCQRAMRTAVGVQDGFGKLLAGGLGFIIALQVFVVVGGVTRLIPVTGMTLPFMAYGGSSLIANWMIVALLLHISDASRRPAAAPLTPAEQAEVRSS